MFVCSTEEPMYLIANGSLITRVPGDEFFMKDGGVVVVGSRIAEVGTTAELVSKYPRAEFIDACGGIIMPGFIDAHTRFYSSLTCGFDLPVSERAEYYEFLHNGRWSIDRHLTLDLVKCPHMLQLPNELKTELRPFSTVMQAILNRQGALVRLLPPFATAAYVPAFAMKQATRRERKKRTCNFGKPEFL